MKRINLILRQKYHTFKELGFTMQWSFYLKHQYKNGVLRKLKHIFPNTYQRIKSIHSPAKVGTGCYRFNYQPGS